jgi:hypothetical protein
MPMKNPIFTLRALAILPLFVPSGSLAQDIYDVCSIKKQGALTDIK